MILNHSQTARKTFSKRRILFINDIKICSEASVDANILTINGIVD